MMLKKGMTDAHTIFEPPREIWKIKLSDGSVWEVQPHPGEQWTEEKVRKLGRFIHNDLPAIQLD